MNIMLKIIYDELKRLKKRGDDIIGNNPTDEDWWKFYRIMWKELFCYDLLLHLGLIGKEN